MSYEKVDENCIAIINYFPIYPIVIVTTTKFANQMSTALRNKSLFFIIIALFFSIAHGKSTHSPPKNSITLFSAPNAYSKIITELPEKAKVEVLGTDMGTGFGYVRTQDQQKGWIKMKYLQEMPTHNGLVPVTPPKATPESSKHFTSWLQQKWQSAKNTIGAKKKIIMSSHDWIFATSAIILIGILIRILLTRHNAHRRKQDLMWRA